MKRLVPLLAILFFLAACSDNKPDTTNSNIDPAFTGYVSAFTSGVVSNSSAIRIRLTEPVASADMTKPVAETLFEFSPAIDGEVFWSDSQTLEFRPAEGLDPGQAYEAEFLLSKVMAVPENLARFKFAFEVMQQALFVNFDGFQAYDRENLRWQQVMGTVRTADYSDDLVIENAVVATQEGKNLSITWEHAGDGQTHTFTVDSVHRTESHGEVLLNWDGDAIGAAEQGEETIEIPPLGDFSVVSAKVVQQPEQYVSVAFSDPVNTQQDLRGLLRLQSGVAVRIDVRGNEVRVYPTDRQSGTTRILADIAITNSMGYQQTREFSQSVTFTNTKPDLELIGDGVIIPHSNGLLFPFKAVNLSAVDVRIIKIFENNVAQYLQVNQLDGRREMKRVGRLVYKEEVQLKADKPIDYGAWNTFSLDLSDMIETEPGAIYTVRLSFRQHQSLYPCGEDNVDAVPLPAELEDPEFAKYDNPGNYWDYWDDYYYDYEAGYRWEDRDNPCKPSYYMVNDHWVSRNVLASDMGIIAKGGNSKSLKVAVTDMRSTDPMAGVEVEIYNFQNQLMGTQTTDGDGFAEIDLARKPFLLIARNGPQRGYLRLDDGSALSLSMFDVGGVQVKKGVKGYLYGERGVWRPGDSLYVSFILEDKLDAIPANHPVTFELFTPENQLYQKMVRTRSLNGFYDFRTATQSDAPTGRWLAKVKVGGSEFTKSLRIETVKPNRLKLALDFGIDVIEKGINPTGELAVKWLHGAIAKNLRATVEVEMKEGTTSFDEYKDYCFDDPAKDFYSEEVTLFDDYCNDQGLASVSTDFNVSGASPGMLNAHFKVRAFERGGDFSVDRFTLPYSPYDSYVGLKVPEGKGWNGALYSNESNMIPIATVDASGNPVDRSKVKIEVFDLGWRWWWERNSTDDLARYVGNNRAHRFFEDEVDTRDGKATYELKMDRDHWGRAYIRVTDPVSGHQAGKVVYFTYKGWWSNAGSDNPGGAEMLTFSTNQKTYNVGDEVRLELPASAGGRALVSVESGSEVLDLFWEELTGQPQTLTFIASEEMAPNAFVHISLLQPHNQVENDLPIRMYGVQPIRVEDPDTHLEPQISMPDVLAPEETFTVKVNEKQGKPMTYTIAVVDDGLLDLTRFQTPDAWSTFYAREALGVKTWDMYNYVVGAFTGEMAGLLALGGSDAIGKNGGKKANRFKPVVTFLGPFELASGASASHEITMPNYVGSVRTMVVAGQDGAYGSADKTTPVKKPLMVLASLPRVLGPTETVKLPVTVFAMDDKVKNVTVSVEANQLLRLKGASSQQLKFTEQGDDVVNFELESIPATGIGKIKVTAKSGKEVATYNLEFDVRPSNPRVTRVVSEVVQPGATWTHDYVPLGMAGTNNGMLEVSAVPPMNLEHRLQYLIRYPHGCIEQTTSGAFPQLYVKQLLDLSDERKKEIDINIAGGIQRLRLFQLPNGGLTYWPGENDHASDWGTNYAGHFLVEAKRAGYALPPGMFKDWVRYQTQAANNWSGSFDGTHRHYYNSGDLIQAYRLFTLALAEKPAIGAMNRMRQMKGLSNAARWRLAAAYQLAGKTSVAKSIINNLDTSVESYKELSYSYGSSERDQAMILEALVMIGETGSAKHVFDDLVKNLGSDRWYSTQTTAFSLLAVSRFVGTTGSGSTVAFSYDMNGTKGKANSSAPIAQLKVPVKGAESGKVSMTNTSGKTLFVKLQMDGIPVIGDQTSTSSDLNMKVKYLSMDDDEIDPSLLEQGTDFKAEVTIKHPGTRNEYKEMALTQIFPSGWEIRNTRMDLGYDEAAEVARYKDIRDDRVMQYYDLRPGESKTFTVLLNAAYLGKFYLPTVYSEAMYDNEINASEAGTWVEVVQAGHSTADAN